jgi:hypothetical protein
VTTRGKEWIEVVDEITRQSPTVIKDILLSLEFRSSKMTTRRLDYVLL